MGTKIFGGISSNAGFGDNRDIQVKKYDNFWGLDIMNIPIAAQKIWHGDEVVVGGLNNTIGTDWEDISTFGTDNNYLTQTEVTTVFVSSTASGDCHNDYINSVSGGARIVRLYYLDGSWNAKTADAYMSGTKTVTAATDVNRLNKVEVVSAGVSGEAIGDIYVASAGTQYLKIDAACNESYNGFYYVPDGKNLIITDAFCYPRVDSIETLEFVYKVQEPKLVRDAYMSSTTNYIENYKWAGSFISGASISMAPNMNLPLLVNDRCRIRMRAKSLGGTGKAIGYFKGYLVDKNS